MSERRALVEGLKPAVPPVDPEKEKAFVFRDPKEATAKTNPPSVATPTSATTVVHARVPFSTRMRADFAEALKRASLERQLAKVEPNTLQDMLEQAVEPWLRTNGYLK
jgi:hypothetical protein